MSSKSRVLCCKRFGELYQPSRIREFESYRLLIRRYPDLNWGKRICSPPPYRSAMSPKRFKIDENIPPFACFVLGGTQCLFFVLPSEISFFLIPCLKEICPFFWRGSISAIDFRVSQNTQYLNPSLFSFFFFSIVLKKEMCIFSHKSQNSGQIGTIN